MLYGQIYKMAFSEKFAHVLISATLFFGYAIIKSPSDWMENTCKPTISKLGYYEIFVWCSF